MPDDDSTAPGDPVTGAGGDPTAGSGAESAPATTLSRRQLRTQRDRAARTRWAVAGVAVLLVGGVAVAIAAGASSPPKKAAAAATTTTTTAVAPVTATCPLTGTPAPGGTVPARPALAVKIGNYSGERPSDGLNDADIVFEEPVEGSYTRLVAVFQCNEAALVGDIRSAREPDVAILSQLSNPLFFHAGGITQVLDLLAAAPLQDENMLNGGMESVTIHPPGRYAPYATFTSTASDWALAPSDTTPPAPLFTYSATPPTGSVPGSGLGVHIPFSSDSDVTWTWNPATSSYQRSYSGMPDIEIDGSRTAATNVVVMTVPTFIGTWVENSEGGREVEVVATGTGPVVVLRDGIAITGTWSRSSLTQPAVLTASNGTPITLQPGNTWEELAPQGTPVTTTAAAAPAPAPTTTTTKPGKKKSTKSASH